MILSRRANDDDHRDGFTKWPFMTTHTWGEYPQGTWILEVSSNIYVNSHHDSHDCKESKIFLNITIYFDTCNKKSFLFIT